MTYRQDSDIIYSYGQYIRRENRTLWIVSNCDARSRRDTIRNKLKTYFPIDQYGKCSQTKTFERFEASLFHYKFYLTFENAQCQDYVTEKAFYNALAHGDIPIVLGPDEENYRKILPPNSFIPIQQFKDIKDLAERLHQISNNFDLFSSYHQWRRDDRLITWKTTFYLDDRFCNLCLKLHNDLQPKAYSNFSLWLNQCI